ncbi:hypothetical protein BJV82DRAFT_101300 [Fennellomyces sp. T-0311]|nr:hypothetical protein BJV82DRAFT_101300 [Fennellomyces sp. T-0311]
MSEEHWAQWHRCPKDVNHSSDTTRRHLRLIEKSSRRVRCPFVIRIRPKAIACLDRRKPLPWRTDNAFQRKDSGWSIFNRALFHAICLPVIFTLRFFLFFCSSTPCLGCPGLAIRIRCQCSGSKAIGFWLTTTSEGTLEGVHNNTLLSCNCKSHPSAYIL